jgi:hypothetical protein
MNHKDHVSYFFEMELIWTLGIARPFFYFDHTLKKDYGKQLDSSSTLLVPLIEATMNK